jgi:flagellar basal-body rod protein FlgG
VFEDLLYQNLRQPGAQSTQQTTIPSGLQIGTGVRPIATERIHTQGNLTQTGNALDVAIQGEGFFQILLPDGTTAYTRDGAFQKDANGQMVTSSGYALQPAITIPANALSVTIGKDGVVSVTLPNQAAPAQIGNIQLATSSIRAACRAWAKTSTWKPPPAAPPTPTRRAPTASACSTRPTWRPPTSTWPKSWC